MSMFVDVRPPVPNGNISTPVCFFQQDKNLVTRHNISMQYTFIDSRLVLQYSHWSLVHVYEQRPLEDGTQKIRAILQHI